mmetsp:Transcript_27782/g.52874  ORF Transcript_27782/g.52874 Transcript_27782/m.52874 type:complete len:321 (+) Transcript_27782:254-1216(+)
MSTAYRTAYACNKSSHRYLLGPAIQAMPSPLRAANRVARTPKQGCAVGGVGECLTRARAHAKSHDHLAAVDSIDVAEPLSLDGRGLPDRGKAFGNSKLAGSRVSLMRDGNEDVRTLEESLAVDPLEAASMNRLLPLDGPIQKAPSMNSLWAAGGGFGRSQQFVLAVLLALTVSVGVGSWHWGMAAAEAWWDSTNLIQRTAPLYMISLLPYLDFLWKLQQSKPQSTNSMVFAFAFVLVFVVISTPVEMFSRVQLGKDVADVDVLHFLVQSLITATNFFIIVAFKKQIDRVKEAKKNKRRVPLLTKDSFERADGKPSKDVDR